MWDHFPPSQKHYVQVSLEKKEIDHLSCVWIKEHYVQLTVESEDKCEKN
jgi:hypothetical protein